MSRSYRARRRARLNTVACTAYEHRARSRWWYKAKGVIVPDLAVCRLTLATLTPGTIRGFLASPLARPNLIYVEHKKGPPISFHPFHFFIMLQVESLPEIRINTSNEAGAV